jgi:outer membrane receptor protein involved in Fe transport
MDRMPNLPFLFGNADANFSIRNFVHKTDKVTMGYSLNFVEKFYRNWQAEGGDINIPRQLAHDIHISYAILNGKYTANLEIRNVTNELLYDNYSLQKPGRAFNVSFRATIF